MYDVTDLVRLDEMRSELVAVASHELQTPLTTLRMTLLMLQEASDVLPERHRELVATSLIGVEQLTETVHEFLDLTRIEAGELRLNLEPVHISSVRSRTHFDESKDRRRRRASQLSARVDSDLPRILGDPLRLRAVFDNILSNALKYTPDGGRDRRSRERITSRGCRRRARRVSISVTDTGPGIPVAFRPRIFDKFFRLEHHQTEGHAGSARRGYWPLHVPADRRVAWRRDLVRFRP